MSDKTPPLSPDVEKRFDDMFPKYLGGTKLEIPEGHICNSSEGVKQFLSQELANAVEEEREKYQGVLDFFLNLGDKIIKETLYNYGESDEYENEKYTIVDWDINAQKVRKELLSTPKGE
jgi:hypothetical protein